MSFQKTVNINPPIGIEGTFATIGVTHSSIAGAMQFVAGPTGLTISRLVGHSYWRFKTISQPDVTNWVNGYVGRDSNIAVITNWQGQSTLLVPSGMAVTAYDRGDFFAKSKTAAVVGQKVFSSDTDGTISNW